MTDATLRVGIWDHIDLAQCHIGQAIGKSRFSRTRHCGKHGTCSSCSTNSLRTSASVVRVIIVGIFKGLGSLRDQFGRATETPLTQLIRGSMIAQPLYYPNPTPKNVPPRHGADRSRDQCTK
jgi:hypothetical protein